MNCGEVLTKILRLRREKAIPESAIRFLEILLEMFAEQNFPDSLAVRGEEIQRLTGMDRKAVARCVARCVACHIICHTRGDARTPAVYSFSEGWRVKDATGHGSGQKKVSSFPLSSPLSSSPETLSPYPPIIPPTTIQENFCAELGFCAKPSHEDSTQNVEPAFIEMPLIDGTLYAVTQTDVKRYKELFPAVDVEQELRSMTAWLENNPKNRKTRGGIKRYISNWLIRKQNRSQTQKPKQPAWEPKYYFAEFDND